MEEKKEKEIENLKNAIKELTLIHDYKYTGEKYSTKRVELRNMIMSIENIINNTIS